MTHLASWEVCALFTGCVAIATCIQNLTGFAFGLVLLGLVSVLELASVADAANAATVLTLVNAALYFRWHRLRPEWRIVRPAILPSLLGVGVGVMMLTWLSGNAAQWLRGLLGVAILACAVGLLVESKPRATVSGRGVFAFVGAISGLMGGLFSSAGPPLVYHLYRQPAPREVIQQCLFLMFAINQVLRLALVAGSGHFSARSALLSATAIPAVFGVTWLQRRYMPPVGIVATRRVVSGLLILAGGSLVASVLAAGVLSGASLNRPSHLAGGAHQLATQRGQRVALQQVARGAAAQRQRRQAGTQHQWHRHGTDAAFPLVGRTGESVAVEGCQFLLQARHLGGCASRAVELQQHQVALGRLQRSHQGPARGGGSQRQPRAHVQPQHGTCMAGAAMAHIQNL